MNNIKNYKKIILYVIIYFGLIFISLKGNIGYVPIGFVILSSLLLLSLVTWLILRILKRQTAKFFAILGMICILVFISIFSLSRIGLKITTKRANFIIERIMEYKYIEGCYPKSLNELKPSYISNIPKPTFSYSDTFIYELIDCRTDSTNMTFCDNFILKYYGPLEMEAKYTSQKKIWEYDD